MRSTFSKLDCHDIIVLDCVTYNKTLQLLAYFPKEERLRLLDKYAGQTQITQPSLTCGTHKRRQSRGFTP
eukprot:2463577-Rhodomonas_salina.3